MISTVISAIVVGAIIGAFGRLVVRGRQHISIVATIVIGNVAALIGTAIANARCGQRQRPGLDQATHPSCPGRHRSVSLCRTPGHRLSLTPVN